MQVLSWLVVKINCRINVRTLFKWQYIHLYSGVASVTARQYIHLYSGVASVTARYH
jgi:hypothetical protein